MEFDDIERILELVRQHDLAEFELERDGLKLRVRKANTGYAPVVAPVPVASLAAGGSARAGLRVRGAGARAGARRARRAGLELAVVKSPIVGTFYRRRSRARRRSSKSASTSRRTRCSASSRR